MRRGGQKGNQNAAKGRRWEEALRRALARSEGSVDTGLDPIADTVVKAARAGELEAIREIACRLDGKPTEHVYVDQEVTFDVGDTSNLRRRMESLLEASEEDPVRGETNH